MVLNLYSKGAMKYNMTFMFEASRLGISIDI